MKRLTVLRHAKSSWGELGLDDFDRPLNARGREAARRVGRELKRREIGFDFVIASPAVRVRETLDGVAEGCGRFAVSVRFEPEIYGADADTLLRLVRGFPDDAERALLVGHNPGLEQLIAELTKGDDSLRRRVVEKFPTAALAVVELPASHWCDLAPHSGTLVELILPKELD